MVYLHYVLNPEVIHSLSNLLLTLLLKKGECSLIIALRVWRNLLRLSFVSVALNTGDQIIFLRSHKESFHQFFAVSKIHCIGKRTVIKIAGHSKDGQMIRNLVSNTYTCATVNKVRMNMASQIFSDPCCFKNQRIKTFRSN